MIGYLHAKVKASLWLAVSVTLLWWAFGVKFALMWGVLTFSRPWASKPRRTWSSTPSATASSPCEAPPGNG